MPARSTILFVTPPEAGHLLPTVSVAKGLAKEGYHIVYLTAGFFAPLLRAYNFDVSPLLPPEFESEATRWSAWTYWYVFESVNGISAGLALVSRIRSLLRERDISGVVVDDLFVDSYGSALVSFLCTIPSFALGTMLKNFDQRHIVNSVPRAVLCPSAFEIPSLVMRCDNYHYVEPSLYDWRTPSHEDEPSSATQHVLVAFGSQSGMHRNAEYRVELVATLARAFPTTIFTMACGRHAHPAECPSNLQCLRTMPQGELLRTADLFITHGGLSSIKEAIASSVPMIVMPSLFDQPFNAARVEFHNLGKAIFPEEMTADVLLKTYELVRSSHFIKERIMELGHTFIEANQDPVAASLITRHFESF